MAGLHVCVCACMDMLGMLRQGAPSPCLSDNTWSGSIWGLFGWLCLTECSQMDYRKWLWEVGKISEREECRVNAMRSGTLKKKYLKRISKTFVVCKVTPIFPKNFGKKWLFAGLELLKLCMCFSQVLHHKREKTALYMVSGTKEVYSYSSSGCTNCF